jgi:hypothetical protein
MQSLITSSVILFIYSLSNSKYSSTYSADTCLGLTKLVCRDRELCCRYCHPQSRPIQSLVTCCYTIIFLLRLYITVPTRLTLADKTCVCKVVSSSFSSSREGELLSKLLAELCVWLSKIDKHKEGRSTSHSYMLQALLYAVLLAFVTGWNAM